MTEAFIERAHDILARRHDKLPQHVVDGICDMIGSEGKSLREACEKHNVKVGKFLYWVSQEIVLDEQYQRARQASGDFHASLIIDKAIELLDGPDLTQAQVQAIRVAIDALKWTAARLHHAGWGEKKTQTVDLGSNFMSALQRIETTVRSGNGAKVIEGTARQVMQEAAAE